MGGSLLKYHEHKAFSPFSNKLPTPSQFIEEFNTYYTFLEKSGKFLESYDQKKLSGTIKELLNHIFQDLIDSSASEKNELQHFLKELYLYSDQLLDRDLKNFFLKPKSFHAQKLVIPSCQAMEWANCLFSDRYFTGKISCQTLKTLQSVVQPIIEDFRYRALKGNTKRENLSINDGHEVQELVKIINSEFEESGVNLAISSYHSCPMKVGGLAVELSVENANWWNDSYGVYNEGINTIYMHTDESLSVPKAIVYLTDVSEKNGPFSVINHGLEYLSPSPIQFLLGRIIGCVGRNKSSSLYDYYHKTFGCPKYREHFMYLPEDIQYNSHFGWDIIPSSFIEKELLDQENIQIGDAGSYTVFDGSRLVHRGGLLKEGERIALQVCFVPVPTVPTLKARIINRVKSKFNTSLIK